MSKTRMSNTTNVEGTNKVQPVKYTIDAKLVKRIKEKYI
jgi:hypothetical protein